MLARRIRLFYKNALRLLKRGFPSKLLGRSLLILILPIIFLQIVVTAVFFERHYADQIITQSEQLGREIAMIVKLYERFGVSGSVLEQASDKGDALYTVKAPENSLLNAKDFYCAKRYVADTGQKAVSRILGQPVTMCRSDMKNRYILFVPLQKNILEVRVGRKRFISPKWHFLLVWTSGASILSLIIAVIFMKNQVRPVRKLAKAAEAFGRGNYAYFYSPSGAYEVRRAGEAFLTMRDRVSAHIKQRTMLLAGVSHDLRTLLTRFSFGLSLYPLSEKDVTDLQGDVRQMKDILTEYLNFAENAEAPKQAAQSICVKDMLKEVAAPFDCETFALTTDISAEIGAETYKIPEAGNLKRCLMNILDNARKFATAAHISVSGRAYMLEMIIEDNGCGVPEDAFEEIFKPFYKIDAARSLNAGGTGLGLALTKDLANAVGGRVKAEKSKNFGGLAIILTWPFEDAA